MSLYLQKATRHYKKSRFKSQARKNANNKRGSIAEIAWHIESKGLVATAEKFADNVYDFFLKLSDSRKIHALCRD